MGSSKGNSDIISYMTESQKIRVAVIAGARSTEHEVSLVSAYNIAQAIDRNKYDVYVVGIGKDGIWRQYDPDNFVTGPASVGTAKLSDEPISGRLAVTQCSREFYDIDNGGKAVFEADVIFPAVLGNYAEDGTIQGLLRMMDVPFTTPDVLGSAVGMDKDVAYRLMRDAGINVAKFRLIRKGSSMPSYDELRHELEGGVMFIKPSNAGSSVGVTRVTNQAELDTALEHAFHYDVKVIAQAAVVGREVEISVMGNIGSQRTSVVGEIVTLKEGDFYSYGNKYINSDQTSALIAPAELSNETYEEISRVAVRVCETLECEGFSRVDFFIGDSGKVYVNEINTMPGFTSISMFPKLWGVSGVDYPTLVDTLLEYARERHAYRIAPMVLDASDVLEIAKKMGAV